MFLTVLRDYGDDQAPTMLGKGVEDCGDSYYGGSSEIKRNQCDVLGPSFTSWTPLNLIMKFFWCRLCNKYYGGDSNGPIVLFISSMLSVIFLLDKRLDNKYFRLIDEEVSLHNYMCFASWHANELKDT